MLHRKFFPVGVLQLEPFKTIACYSRRSFILIFMLLAGCQANHLVYVQEVSLGLNVGVGAEGMAKVSLGYDRDVYAIVPKTGDSSNNDAMSLFSVNKTEINSINDLSVEEFVATGEPAEKLTESSGMIQKLRNSIIKNSTIN